MALIVAGAAGAGACGKEAGTAPPADTTAPSTPTGISATPISPTRIEISWHPASDNVGVAGYRLFRDEVFFARIADTVTVDAGRTPRTQYCYAVSAYDAAGNESARGGPACAATIKRPPVAALDAPDSGETGVAIRFDAGRSSDSDGVISSYAFAFGDGATATSPTPQVSHVYTAVGKYTVTVNVTDDVGDSATASRQVAISLADWYPVNISHGALPAYYESADRDAGGGVNVVWQSNASVMFARSTDGGATWGKPAPVVAPDDFWAKFAYEMSQMRVASTGDGVIHVAWTVFALDFTEVVYSRSTDGGATFSSPQLISTADARSRRPC